MEIILLRHGKPNVELTGSVNAHEFKQLNKEYAASGIEDHPPVNLNNIFNSHTVVCSHLNRSLQTAKKLGLSYIHLSDEIFAEADIPHFDKFIFRLPIPFWVVSLRLMWLFGFSKNSESFKQAKQRAKQASLKLIEIAEKNKKVLLIGHGLMNRLIARELRLNNWQGPKSPGRKYWEYALYTD